MDIALSLADDDIVVTRERVGVKKIKVVDEVGHMLSEILDELEAKKSSEGIPVWADFDVVVVHMGTDRRPYTYMREDGEWPGRQTWSSLTDERMDKLWRAGRVTLVISAGIPLTPPRTLTNVDHPAVRP